MSRVRNTISRIPQQLLKIPERCRHCCQTLVFFKKRRRKKKLNSTVYSVGDSITSQLASQLQPQPLTLAQHVNKKQRFSPACRLQPCTRRPLWLSLPQRRSFRNQKLLKRLCFPRTRKHSIHVACQLRGTWLVLLLSNGERPEVAKKND